MKSLDDWKNLNKKLNGLTIYVVSLAVYFGSGYLKDIDSKIEKTNIKLTEVELQVSNIENKTDKLSTNLDHKLELFSLRLRNNQDSLRYMFEEHSKIQKRFIGWKIDESEKRQTQDIVERVTDVLSDFNNQGVNIREGRIINYSNPKR